jgi:hypothetical protein
MVLQYGSGHFLLRGALPTQAKLVANVPPSRQERTLNPGLPTCLPVMTVDWIRPLTCTLTLKSGERLATLLDTADLLSSRFQGVIRHDPLEHAITLLLRAAETGTRADREGATD